MVARLNKAVLRRRTEDFIFWEYRQYLMNNEPSTYKFQKYPYRKRRKIIKMSIFLVPISLLVLPTIRPGQVEFCGHGMYMGTEYSRFWGSWLGHSHPRLGLQIKNSKERGRGQPGVRATFCTGSWYYEITWW